MADKDSSEEMDKNPPEVAADQPSELASPDGADDSIVADVVEDAEVVEDPTPAAEDTEVPEPEATAPEQPVTPEPRKGGVMPLVLGGLIAGGIGFGAAEYLPRYLSAAEVDPLDAVRATQSSLQDDVSQLSQGLATLEGRPQAPDLSSDVAGLSAQLNQLSDQLATLQANAMQNADRITVLEKRPLTEVVAPDAIAAYNAELDALRSSVAAELAAVTEVADTARAEITAAKEQAAALELSAQDAARKGAAQSAVNSIAASLAAGGGYADTLVVLQNNTDLEIPAVLVENATDGVPTQAALQEQFPELARQALAAARADAPVEDGESGFGAFFRSQLNVRSLTPQEGSSADAVLSRAEAAVKAGDLETALAEIQALPQSAADVLAPWVTNANMRADAQRAAADLSAQLSQN